MRYGQDTASDFSILAPPLYVRQACQERLEGKYWPFCNFCSTPQWDWRFSSSPPDYVIQQALDWIIVWLTLWWPQSFHTVMMIMICGRRTYYLGPTLYGLLWHICFSFAWQTVTARLKWKKRFLAGGFPIFLGRWSDQTFFESSNKTKTENICTCWIFVKTKDLSKIFVKIVPSEV